MDINSLDRFVFAQERAYGTALSEVRNGKKRTHWMWFIFPQLRGLGMSQMSFAYGISGLREAKAYLAHPTLSANLLEITESLLTLPDNDPEEIFGEIDAVKLRSSMTLFASISPEDSPFHKVLGRYYNGEPDERTLELLC